MLLILTNSFSEKELKPLRKFYNINDIKKTVLKVAVKPANLSSLGYKDGRLLKLRVVNKVAGRMIVYLFIKKFEAVPIILCLKKDKIFGKNLSINNKRAKALILKMLDLAMEDIQKENYTKIKL